MNNCVNGCDISGIRLTCSWFSSACLINPKVFKRLRYNDYLINDGRALINAVTDAEAKKKEEALTLLKQDGLHKLKPPIAYGLDKKTTSVGENVLIFDLGGGTLNVKATAGITLSLAQKLFDKISTTNVRCWIALIGTCARCGFYKHALAVFSEMQTTQRLKPNNVFVIPSFDMAIHDGVDVLSVSLGGSTSTFFNNSVSIGSFHAAKKGIVVVCSAGNSGPVDATAENFAP
ncbi:Peptidase S8/S53 domain [Sesbania bispinosa]|nr:Peptidase S8/S53 domain [Sesbania bispinosa]